MAGAWRFKIQDTCCSLNVLEIYFSKKHMTGGQEEWSGVPGWQSHVCVRIAFNWIVWAAGESIRKCFPGSEQQDHGRTISWGSTAAAYADSKLRVFACSYSFKSTPSGVLAPIPCCLSNLIGQRSSNSFSSTCCGCSRIPRSGPSVRRCGSCKGNPRSVGSTALLWT